MNPARLLPLLLACCLPAFAQTPLPPAQTPDHATAHWHSGKTLQRKSELTAVDLVGSNHIQFPGWASISPSGGFLISGAQTEGVRLEQRQPVSDRFKLGVDLNPATDGAEHQTAVYLYGFCELRYRLSRQELTLNVWQNSITEPGKIVVSSVKLPLPAGKWSRVEAVIDRTTARLRVGETVAEVPLSGTFEFLPAGVPVFIAFGGSDRAYKGLFNHLHFSDLR